MTLHTKLSYVKSAARLVGYCFVVKAAFSTSLPSLPAYLLVAGLVLIASELIGIAEEAWPGAYEGTVIDLEKT